MREGLQKIVEIDDTIVAVSTPYGRSGIGIIRISGPATSQIVQKFFSAARQVKHRTAVVGRWLDAEGEAIDEVVVTFFAVPNSYTGEDLLEVSAHGNPLVLDRIVRTTFGPGVRIASPGEFTLRAVTHGKMDLIQAEAVRDFIEAQTVRQARTARSQMEGALSRRLGPIKEELINVIAHVEAGIDFADDDVAPPDSKVFGARLDRLDESLAKLQSTYNFGKLVVEGLRVVLAGKPNVGKSSIFNKLLSSERAIVTDIPGTTRDVLSEVVTVDGIPLRLFDTAGLRQATETVEKMGVVRTLEALGDADLALVVVDGSLPLGEEDLQILDRTQDTPRVIVVNKCDLGLSITRSTLGESQAAIVSAKTGEGIEEIFSAIRSHVGRDGGEPGESVLTNVRHNEQVLRAMGALRKASRSLASGTPHEMIVLDLYEGLSALNELTGDTVTDDILGRIFSTFCIGK